ncbi:MAG: Rqc2 family fibronectin-binding protein, partial [Anaeroplasmataceae bacterium]
LKDIVLNAKIDRINQPEKDEIILTFRKDRKNLKLLISASSKFPRIHLTNTNKVNPLKASTFTMVLRKYLIGGKITSFEQLNGDRIIKLNIESTDELGFDSKYFLIVEIMGRHSNITLIRERDNKVMECIKHITPDINSFRVLYPGVNYIYPPISSKLNPFDFTLDELTNYFNSNDLIMSESIFSSVFTGISKSLSLNLYNLMSTTSENITINTFYSFILDFILTLDNNFSYTIYKTDTLYKDFYCLPLKTLEDNYQAVKFDNPGELLEEFFYIRDKQERLNSRSIDIQRIIQTNIDRCNKKSKKLYSTLEECSLKDDFKIKGDLLTSYIYTLKKGDTEANLVNFYSESQEYLTIPLDEFKTPSENIQTFYKKYNKYKKSEESAIFQLEQNENEINYLNSVMTNIQNCDTYIEINDIRNELIETGYVKFKKLSNNNKRDKASKPLHFVSSDGLDIYVGKNNIQNDYLSLKFANNNHLWFHTKNIPGSHVIVASPNVPDRTIEEAAILAAYYSKAKTGTKVPVDYTLVKNLKKPNGAKPGMVIYNTNYSLYTEPSEYNNLVRKLNNISSNS